MQKKLTEFNLSQRKAKINFKTGDVIKIYRKIKEGAKERIQVFEGMIIAIKGRQSSSPTMTVRKISNGVGVEVVLPVFSPSIDKIELVKRAKVKRSKLYYVRDKVAKALRFKFTYFEGENKKLALDEEVESEIKSRVKEEAKNEENVENNDLEKESKTVNNEIKETKN